MDYSSCGQETRAFDPTLRVSQPHFYPLLSLPTDEPRIVMASSKVARLQGQHLSIVGDTPSDLWYEIARLSYPPEIASLQSTCRALRELLFQKSVWVAALKAMCRQNHLFLPSYPTEQMSLANIQRCALGPYIFKKLVQENSSVVARSKDEQLLANVNPDSKAVRTIAKVDFQKPHGIGDGMSSSASGIYLVPGGRFAVVFDGNSLALWDLGVAGVRPNQQASRVAQVTFAPGTFPAVEEGEGGHGPLIEGPRMSVRHRGDGLRIAVAWGRGTVIAKAFDVLSVDNNPDFILLGTLAINATHEERRFWCKELEVYDNRALITVGRESREFIIWNFVESRFSVIDARSSQRIATQKVLLTQYHIVELASNGVVVWFIHPQHLSITGQPVVFGDPPITPHSHLRPPLAVVLKSYPHLYVNSFIGLRTVEVSIAGIHQGQLPLIFDVITWVSEEAERASVISPTGTYISPDPSKERDIVIRYRLSLSHAPDDLTGTSTTINFETVSKSIFPGPQSRLLKTDNPTALFVPDTFFAGLVRTMEGHEPGPVSLMNFASSATDYVYSPDYPESDDVGLGKVQRKCDREGCSRREESRGQFQRCSACQMVIYCGAQCQKKDWKLHKPTCQRWKSVQGIQGPVPVRLTPIWKHHPILESFLGLCTASGRHVSMVKDMSLLMPGLNVGGGVPSAKLVIKDFLAEE